MSGKKRGFGEEVISQLFRFWRYKQTTQCMTQYHRVHFAGLGFLKPLILGKRCSEL